MLHRTSSMLRIVAALVVASALVFAVGGCTPPSHDLKAGRYRAVVELPGGEVPFSLDVEREKALVVIYLVNGKERVRVSAVVDAQGHLTADFPGTGNHLDATVSGDEIEGKVMLSGKGAAGETAAGARAEEGRTENIVLDFAAVRGRSWRFVEEPLTDNADFAGRWSVTFTDDSDRKTPAVAEFKQSFHSVAGTIRTRGWELASLAGDAHDEELGLSLFDGTQAVLCRGELNERGELAGECWSTGAGHAKYTATRNPDATLEP